MGCSKFTTEQAVVKADFATKWADNITYFADIATAQLNTTVSGTYGMVEIWDTFLCEVSYIIVHLNLRKQLYYLVKDILIWSHRQVSTSYVVYITARSKINSGLSIILVELLKDWCNVNGLSQNLEKCSQPREVQQMIN